MPYEIDLRPPAGLLHASVGEHEVPVLIFKTEEDANANRPDTYTFTVNVKDVDECTNKQLPKEWQAECNGAYTYCENRPGSYACKCYAGTLGVRPCEGESSSTDCSHSCVNPGRDWETRCHREFACGDVNECNQDDLNDCHKMATCTDIPCDQFEGRHADPVTCENSFKCGCKDGYEGKGHGEDGCTGIDECAVGTHDCDAHADCTDADPTDENGWTKFECACRKGYEGDGKTCDAKVLCAEVDRLGLCEPKVATCQPCTGKDVNDESVKCRDSPTKIEEHGKFKCVCKTHYEGDGFNPRANPENEGCKVIDYCVHEKGNDCNDNAACVDEGEGAYHCDCNGGYESKTPGAHGSNGCQNIDECSSNNLHDCHYGAECTDHTPTKDNDGLRYSCKCKEEEGWAANTDAPKPAYGANGCKDNTPPKAFIMCESELRTKLDMSAQVKVQTVARTPEFATCEPEYTEMTQTEAQHCKCKSGNSVFEQYSGYKELGMVVKDDSHELHSLKQVTGYAKLPVDHGGHMYLTRVGTFKEAVQYSLTPTMDGVRGDKQSWYREIEVTSVDECKRTDIPEQFQHKCHEYAECNDNDKSYGCKCFDGYGNKTHDGYKKGAGKNPEEEGCADTRPPVIHLAGKYPLEIQECLCGGGALAATPPTPGQLTSNGLSASAVDRISVKREDGSWDHAFKKTVAVTQVDATMVECADIPQAGEGLDQHKDVDFEEFSCDHVTSAWKISYNAEDEAGNAAAPRAHYVIVRQVEVLKRLLELEAFVADYNNATNSTFEKIKTAHDDTKSRLSSFNAFVTLWTQRVTTAVGAAVLIYVLWHGMVPTIFKMFNALLMPSTMRRREFEHGYDLWCRIRSVGFATALDRAQATEEAWAAVEDARVDDDGK